MTDSRISMTTRVEHTMSLDYPLPGYGLYYIMGLEGLCKQKGTEPPKQRAWLVKWGFHPVTHVREFAFGDTESKTLSFTTKEAADEARGELAQMGVVVMVG